MARKLSMHPTDILAPDDLKKIWGVRVFKEGNREITSRTPTYSMQGYIYFKRPGGQLSVKIEPLASCCGGYFLHNFQFTGTAKVNAIRLYVAMTEYMQYLMCCNHSPIAIAVVTNARYQRADLMKRAGWDTDQGVMSMKHPSLDGEGAKTQVNAIFPLHLFLKTEPTGAVEGSRNGKWGLKDALRSRPSYRDDAWA